MADMVKLGRKPEGEGSIASGSDEYFPSLYLDADQIKAMGLDGARVGNDMVMTANIRVASLSQYKSGDGSMTLEIIEAMVKQKEANSETSSILFPTEGK